MNWKTKDKSAWALLIPDASEYDFLPLIKILEKPALEILFNLNFKWQKETFKFIHENLNESIKDLIELPIVKKSMVHDFFIYNKMNVRHVDMNIKTCIKIELSDLKIKLRTRIPNQPDQKTSKINHVAKEILSPKNSTAGKMKSIFEELLKKYIQVTVWNLESLVLSPEHFTQAFSSTLKTGSLFTLTSPENRLILMSYNSENIDENKKVEILNQKISAIYDLKSLQDMICTFSAQNSKSSQTKAEELANAIQTIRQHLPVT